MPRKGNLPTCELKMRNTIFGKNENKRIGYIPHGNIHEINTSKCVPFKRNVAIGYKKNYVLFILESHQYSNNCLFSEVIQYSHQFVITSIIIVVYCAGADPGFRRGGSYIQKGGFRTGISGVDPNCCRALGKSTSKKKLQTAVGGGGVRSPKKNPCIRACCGLFYCK